MGSNPSVTTTSKVNSQSGGKPQDAKGSSNFNQETERREQSVTAADRQRNFNYTILQYPDDLAQSSRHPYWMTFYINKQELSKYKKGSSARAFAEGDAAGQSAAQRHASRGGNSVQNVNVGKGPEIGFGRKTTRTASAIRLFIPDSLSWSFTNSFRDASISGIPYSGVAQVATTVAQLASSMFDTKSEGGLLGSMASLVSNAAKNINSAEGRAALGATFELADHVTGASNQGLGLSAIGLAVNPQVDVLYGSPELRTFTFDFLFAPRNGSEAYSVSQIIKEFKFHSAPESLGEGLGVGRFFVPPSEFDIEFSLDSMGKISTCVLQNVTVDYAPSGVAFYADGEPVSTRMTLQFKELEFITKELVEEGY